jgi:hypothetical protein
MQNRPFGVNMCRFLNVAKYARFRGSKKLMDSGIDGPIITFDELAAAEPERAE